MTEYIFEISLIADTILEFSDMEELSGKIVADIFNSASIWSSNRTRNIPDNMGILLNGEVYPEISFEKPPEETVRYRRPVQKFSEEGQKIQEILYRVYPQTEVMIRIYWEIDEEYFEIKQLLTFLHENIYRFCRKIDWGSIRLGSNTTLGCGLCHSKEAYLLHSSSDSADERIDSISFSDDEIRRTVNVEVDGHDLEGIIVRSELQKNQGIKTESVKSDQGDYYIPASTWKGIFRKRCTEILKYRKESYAVLDFMFGNYEIGLKGYVIFHDAPITEAKEITEHRRHIDKFTGEAIGCQVNCCVSGNLKLQIEIQNNAEPYVQEALQLIMKVISDIQHKRINVGGEFSTGKGFLEISHVRISEWQKPAAADIYFQEKRIDDPSGILKRYGLED